MTKKSKYLLLGVAGLLVGTAVVAIPVATTANAKAKEAQERNEAIVDLNNVVTSAEVVKSQVDNFYANPAEFNGWVVKEYNNLSIYEKPSNVKEASDALSKLLEDAKLSVLSDDLTKEDYAKQAEQIKEAEVALNNAHKNNIAELTKGVNELSEFINSLTEAAQNTKNVKDAKRAITATLSALSSEGQPSDSELRNTTPIITTPVQTQSILIILAKGLISSTGELNQAVLNFFNKDVEEKDRPLLVGAANLTVDSSFNPEALKARYATSSVQENGTSTQVSDIFGRLFTSYKNAYALVDSETYNEVVYLENLLRDAALPAKVKELAENLKAAQAAKDTVNNQLKASRVAYTNKKADLVKYIDLVVFDDQEVMFDVLTPTEQDANKTTPTWARTYTAAEIAKLQEKVFQNNEQDSLATEWANKITANLYDQQLPVLDQVKANDDFALQRRFYKRAVEHAKKLVNKQTVDSDVQASYETVENSADLITALENAVQAAQGAVEEVEEAQRTTATYQSAKDAINSAVSTFVNSMKAAAVAKYEEVVETIKSHKALYEKIQALILSYNKASNIQLVEDFENLLALSRFEKDILENLYFTPTDLFPGASDDFKNLVALKDQLKVSSSNLTEKDKKELLAKAVAQYAVAAQLQNNFDKGAVATTEGASDIPAFGLVNTLEVARLLDFLKADTEKLSAYSNGLDEKAKKAIESFVTKVSSDKTNYVNAVPAELFETEEEQNALKALKDALNKVFEAPVSLNKPAAEGQPATTRNNYELAEDIYDKASAALDAYGYFEYAIEKQKVAKEIAALGENWSDVPSTAVHENVKASGYLANGVVEGYSPKANLSTALNDARALIIGIVRTADEVPATADSTNKFQPVLDVLANLAEGTDHAQEKHEIIYPAYKKAVEKLQVAINDKRVDNARYEYELAIWNTDHLIPIYESYKLYDAKGVLAQGIELSKEAIKFTDKTTLDEKIAAYQKAKKLVEEYVIRANTASYYDLQTNKENTIKLIDIKSYEIKKLEVIKKPAAILLEQVRAVDKISAELAKQKADKVKEKEQKQQARNQVQDPKSSQAKTLDAEIKSLDDKISVIDKFEANKTALALPTVVEIQNLLSTYDNADTATTTENFKTGKSYQLKSQKLEELVRNLQTQNPALLSSTDANYVSLTQPSSQDITDAIAKINELQAIKDTLHARFKLQRNTQALLVGVLKPAFATEAKLKDTSTVYTNADFVEKDKGADILGDEKGDVRDLLKFDIEALGTLNDQKELSKQLAKDLEVAKVQTETGAIYDALLRPARESYQNALAELKAYQAELAKSSQYDEIVNHISTVLEGMREYDVYNETFANFVNDAKELQAELLLAKYKRAKKDYEVQKDSSLQNKPTDNGGAALIDKAVAVAEAKLHALLAKHILEAKKVEEANKQALETAVKALETELKNPESTKETLEQKTTELKTELAKITNATLEDVNKLAGNKFQNFAYGLSKEVPGLIPTFELQTKELRNAILDAKVAAAVNELNAKIAFFERTIETPTVETSKLTDDTEAEKAKFEIGLLLDQKVAVQNLIQQTKDQLDAYREAALAAADQRTAEEAYNNAKVKELTFALAQKKYEFYVKRFNSMNKLLASFTKAKEDGTGNESFETIFANALKPINEALAAKMNKNADDTYAQSVDERISANETAAKGYYDAYIKVSNDIMTSVNQYIKNNNLDVERFAKDIEKYSNGNPNQEKFVTTSGKTLTFTSIDEFLNALRDANLSVYDNTLPMLFISNNVAVEDNAAKADYNDKPEVKKLIEKYSSLYTKSIGKPAQGEQHTWTIVQNRDRRLQLLSIIEAIENYYIKNDATKITDEVEVQKLQSELDELRTMLFTAQYDMNMVNFSYPGSNGEMKNTMIPNVTRNDVKVVRERLERLADILERKEDYNAAFSALKAQEPWSQETKDEVEQIKAKVAAADENPNVAEAIKVYNEQIKALQVLAAKEENARAKEAAKQTIGLINVLTSSKVAVDNADSEVVEGIYAAYTPTDKSATNFLARWNASESQNGANKHDIDSSHPKYNSSTSNRADKNKLSNAEEVAALQELVNTTATTKEAIAKQTAQIKSINKTVQDAMKEYNDSIKTQVEAQIESDKQQIKSSKAKLQDPAAQLPEKTTAAKTIETNTKHVAKLSLVLGFVSEAEQNKVKEEINKLPEANRGAMLEKYNEVLTTQSDTANAMLNNLKDFLTELDAAVKAAQA
ncbi:coiled-coil domain-containing protein [Mycoplasmopsis glycophila]|uniref:Uncharacterized protein n=1 Tax=Mycoplasmopsis glycophila TaxID=171285 RepID=A0A449AVR6_9BACT|nr:hypothetical protein [Mycoplasmopsis glycophila]VEU70711.1 Uncharacterised protein [Mycoplasmopsis glycophila]